MFGGAAGGGKSVGQLCSALMFVDQPHYRCLIARETLAELTEPNALIDMATQRASGHNPGEDDFIFDEDEFDTPSFIRKKAN